MVPPHARGSVIPTIPDTRVYSWGTQDEFDAWVMQLKNKLEVDKCLYYDDEDEIRYTFSRLEGTALEMAIHVCKGQYNTLNDCFASLSFERFLSLLSRAHLRRQQPEKEPPEQLQHTRRFQYAIVFHDISQQCSGDDATRIESFIHSIQLSKSQKILDIGCRLIEEDPDMEFDDFVREYLDGICLM